VLKQALLRGRDVEISEDFSCLGNKKPNKTKLWGSHDAYQNTVSAFSQVHFD